MARLTIRFPLGVTVRDRITGFTGVVTGFGTYLTGCDQFLVSPPAKDTGEYVDGHWLDDIRLEQLDVAPLALVGEIPIEKRTAGSMTPPSRR